MTTQLQGTDVVIDFAGYEPGREIILVNSAPAPFPGAPGIGVVPDVMKFIVTRDTATEEIIATHAPSIFFKTTGSTDE